MERGREKLIPNTCRKKKSLLPHLREPENELRDPPRLWKCWPRNNQPTGKQKCCLDLVLITGIGPSSFSGIFHLRYATSSAQKLFPVRHSSLFFAQRWGLPGRREVPNLHGQPPPTNQLGELFDSSPESRGWTDRRETTCKALPPLRGGKLFLCWRFCS